MPYEQTYVDAEMKMARMETAEGLGQPVLERPTGRITVEFSIIDGHLLIYAGCKKGVFHSFDEGIKALASWAEELRPSIDYQLSLVKVREKLDTDEKNA